ncbi:autotransporter domain-containing protein [Desulfovibrio sp.]|uniref:autotransporter domain-containing protein n=1 Tax=Desulfovibrio sp. TaxID=885 RepID=UPI003FD772F3
MGVNKDVAITIENIGGKGAITNAGSVTIEKGSIEGPITFEKGGAQADSMVTVGKDGKTTLTGGVAGSGTIDKLAIAEDGKTTITNAKLSGHVGRALWNNGTLTVNDGRFESNKANVAGAIYNAAGAELTVDGVTFANNSSNNVAGAINNRDGKVIITKSTFKDNSVPTSTGGAINNTSGNNPTPLGTITITGSTFEGNKAGNGGAVWNGSNGKVEIADSTFKGNTALAGIGQGGAITNADQMTITGSTFEGNQAGKIGGAIFNAANGSITFNGTNTFTNNTAAGKANDIHNSGAITVSSGTTTLGSGYSQDAGSLTVEGGATLESLGTMEISGGSVAFKDNSLFAVNGNALTGDNAAITVNGGTLEVENKARLRIDNAKNGQTYTIVNNQTGTEQGKWSDGNIEASTDLLTPTMDENGNVTFKRDKDASDVFTGMDSNTAAMLNTLIDKGLNNVDSDQMGVCFLSRATDNRFLGMDKNAAAESIESAARIAFAGAVPQMTRMASDAGTNAVVNRLGFANPADGAQAMDAEGKIVDRNTTGFALWIAPLWQSQHGWGLDAGNMDYGFNGNLGGVSLGADYTFENAIRAGITFNIGGGYAESSGGDLSSTENRMNFWGLGAYAGWNYENFGVMADVSYTSTWNQLKQDLDSRLGMGNKLEADVQASAISAGLRAEYLLQTSAMDIIPHIGVRYMSLNTWGYDVDTHGGTVLEGDSLHQDIWTFPIGVTFSKDFALDSGWNFKPSLDFTVIPAAGDIKAKHDVHFTGLPGTYEVETQMMDYLTWQGGVGLELANDNMSIGVNYTLQAGQHTTGHGVFGSFRYEF